MPIPVIEPILRVIFSSLDNTIGLFFHLSANEKFNAIFGVLAVATLLSAVIVFVTARVVDTKLMKVHKQRISELQEKIKTAQKNGNIKAAAKAQKEMLEVNSKIMSQSFKPMLYTFIPIILVFTWLGNYEYLGDVVDRQGYLVKLPFSLLIWGTQLGWLGWYILCSLPASTLIKKIFDLDT